MINKHIIQTNRLLDSLVQIERNQNARFEELRSYADISLKMCRYSDKNEYFHARIRDAAKGGSTTKYLGDGNNETVKRIKEAKYLKKSLSVLKNDIGLLKSVVDGLCEIDRESIEEMLPATYRNGRVAVFEPDSKKAIDWKRQAMEYKNKFPIFHPEELTQKTDDGTMVRSKSEAIIYNLLLSLGVTFVYELPIKTEERMFYPDFTILSEVDYTSVILIEHQGMMGNPGYREYFKTKLYDYLKAGYVQGINIFYTFDDLGGRIDTDPILDIIKLKVRPRELYPSVASGKVS